MDIKCQSQIQRYLIDSVEQIYWLPWGNRQRNLQIALNHLITSYGWKSQKKNSYSIYKFDGDKDNTLKFFHHDSKTQGGDGKIKHRYDIKYIALAKYAFSPNKDIAHRLIEKESQTWFGISGYSSAKRLGKYLDFASDFDVIESLSTGKKHQMHETEDSYLLFQDLVIVSHFSHRNTNPCNCPHCLTI